MARQPRTPNNNTESQDVGTPQEYPQVPPPVELYPTSDIRFVMVELGKLSTKVDRLIDDVNDNCEKLSELSQKMSTFETTAKVVGGCVTLLALVFWWAFGDYVKAITTNAIKSAILEQQNNPASGNAPVASSPPTGAKQDVPAPPRRP